MTSFEKIDPIAQQTADLTLSIQTDCRLIKRLLDNPELQSFLGEYIDSECLGQVEKFINSAENFSNAEKIARNDLTKIATTINDTLISLISLYEQYLSTYRSLSERLRKDDDGALLTKLNSSLRTDLVDSGDEELELVAYLHLNNLSLIFYKTIAGGYQNSHELLENNDLLQIEVTDTRYFTQGLGSITSGEKDARESSSRLEKTREKLQAQYNKLQKMYAAILEIVSVNPKNLPQNFKDLTNLEKAFNDDYAVTLLEQL